MEAIDLHSPGEILMEITIFKGGSNYGPYPRETVISYLQTGHLSWEDMAWQPGMDRWEKLNSFPEIRSFQTQPKATTPPGPPPPPPPSQSETASSAQSSQTWADIAEKVESSERYLTRITRQYYAVCLLGFLLVIETIGANGDLLNLLNLVAFTVATYGRILNTGVPRKSAVYALLWIPIIPIMSCYIVAAKLLLLYVYGYGLLGIALACLVPQSDYMLARRLDRAGKIMALVVIVIGFLALLALPSASK